MKYIMIPDVAQHVSRIVLGGSGKIFSSGSDVGELIEGALACGINTVDTARAYGESEKAIGRWLTHGNRREKIVLISKGCHPNMAFHKRVNAKAAADDLKRSLEGLNTKQIDIYFLHRDDESIPVGAIVDFLNQHYEEGRIGAFGGSNWSADRISQANAYAARHGLKGFSVSSPHYSLGWQRHDPWGNGCKTITGSKHAKERAFYIETQMPVFAWSSLCGGIFSGELIHESWKSLQKVFGFNTKWGYGSQDNRERLFRCEKLAEEKDVTVAQIALAWLLSGPINTLPIISASDPARLQENAKAAEIQLTLSECAYLNLEIGTY